MQPQNPIENLLDQIAELLKFAEKNAGKPLNRKNTPEIEQQLHQLEDLVAQFDQLTQEQIKLSGITDEEIKKTFSDPTTVSQQNKQIMNRSLDLARDATFLKIALKSAIDQIKKGLATPDKETKKKDVRKRQKKFKQMGGDSKWMPL